MIDLGHLSSVMQNTFSVDVTISREGEADRTESAILLLDGDVLETRGGMTVRVRKDQIAVAHDVDLQRDDVVTCDDERLVAQETSWKITERQSSGDSGWDHTWAMKKA